MTEFPTVYQSLISPKSRRLRATGLVLLTAILLMALYGYFSLMPSLRAATARVKEMETSAAATSNNAANAPVKPISSAAREGKQKTNAPANKGTDNKIKADKASEQKAMAAKVIFAYAYWGVCLALLVAVMLVAWMDFREVGRNFDSQQAAIFATSLKNETMQND